MCNHFLTKHQILIMGHSYCLIEIIQNLKWKFPDSKKKQNHTTWNNNFINAKTKIITHKYYCKNYLIINSPFRNTKIVLKIQINKYFKVVFFFN